MKREISFTVCLLLVFTFIFTASAWAALPLIRPNLDLEVPIIAPKLNLTAKPKVAKYVPALLAFDGTQSQWAEKELQEAYSYGLTYDQVEKDYQNQITREEFCTIAVKLYEKLAGKQAVAGKNPFTDTKNPEILKAYALGIVKGTSADTFSPAQNITRQEICVMILRTLMASKPGLDTGTDTTFPFEDVDQIAAWALDAMKYAYKNEIMKGTGPTTIAPLDNTSREQAIVLLKRTYVKQTGALEVFPALTAGNLSISPNLSKNKIIPSGSAQDPSTFSISSKIDLVSLSKRLGTVLEGPSGGEPAGFPLTSADANIAGVELLGKGYNVITGKYADAGNDSLSQYYLMDIKQLLNNGRVYKYQNDCSDSRFVSGQSAASYSTSMANSVGVSGSYLFFSGTVNTNFSSSSLTETNRSYATLMYKANQYGLYFDDQNINFRDYLTPAFADAVDNMDPEQLFNMYGTHLLRSLQMGGRIEYNATTNSTYSSSSNSLQVDMEASFNSMFASADANFSTSQNEASTNFYENSERNIKAYPAYGSGDLEPAAFDEWFKSMKGKPGISDFGKNPLIGVWKLASSYERQLQLEEAFNNYAAKHNYVPAKVVWGINGIRLQTYRLDDKNNPMPTYKDPVTGDEWKLVSNISAHLMLPDNDLDYLYVREGFSNDVNRPPVVGIFLANETQGEDPVAIFQQLYGDDPTARLWGYAGEMLPGSNLEYYINWLGDKITLHYVTSMKKQPITRLRVRHISTDNNNYYFPGSSPLDPPFLPVMDIGSYNQGVNTPQDCDEGAPQYYEKKINSWYSYHLPVYRYSFIEYSYE